MSDINSVYVCLCSGTDISAEVSPIGVEVCMTVDLSSGQSFSPFGGDVVRGRQM